ncbi:protein-glutamate O-methyltransferase CheR [Clostridiaceae bacterium HSG29]|nr:protein-glutamate O-methyltransferase CheR [Clostridiaceae bacterium HSG29]
MEGYEIFKKNILKLTGINLTSYKERQMKRRIESLIKRNKYNSYSEYFKALKVDEELFDEFINYLTINVSEFYRNFEQWEVLKKTVVPKLLKNNRNLKIWSAACSTGEEPYSLVMLMSDFMPLNRIKILAVDIDEGAINKAKIGVYSKKSLDKVPDKFKKKYFSEIGKSFKISEDIKKCVTFKKMNLLEDKYPNNCDLILCRNVMIYFTEEAKDIMYDKFSGALKNEGILFVGSTEQIIVPKKYNFMSEKTFFYTKNNK